MTAEIYEISPGMALQGKYWLVLLMGVALFLNILTEELFFRAWMLPKLERFGSRAWMINGMLFGLYHIFQLWLLPVILVVSLASAFVCHKSRSIWPPAALHLLLNLLNLIGILVLIAK